MGEALPPVVFCVDRGYRLPLAVAVGSLAEHHTSGDLTIYVIHDGFDADDRALVDAVSGTHHLRWIDADLTGLNRAHLPEHLPRAALFRLVAPALLPDDVERIVYLDADLIVTDDLHELLTAPLGDAALGAVRDAWIEVAGSPHGPPFSELGMAAEAPYLNSGVLVIDVARWKDEQIADQCLDRLAQHRLPYADQCALNAVFEGAWAELPPRWNVQTATGTAASHDTDLIRLLAVQDALASPAIVHFTGRKPWIDPTVVRGDWWDDALVAANARGGGRLRRPAPAPAIEPPAGTSRRAVQATAVRAARRVAGRTLKPAVRSVGLQVRRVNGTPPSARVSPRTVDRVVTGTDRVISAGPFRGMVLAAEATWGGSADIVPKLLGTYEEELHATVEEIVHSRPDRIVNLGCADGYYAVGLARRLPGIETIGVDLIEESLVVAARSAEINGVADQCRFLTHMDLVPVAPDARTVWIIDIEGAEGDLVDRDWPARLVGDTLVVEAHDFNRPGVTAALCQAFDPTHEVAVIDQAGRNPNAIPLLRDLPEAERWLAVSEGRPRPMHWLVFRPRITSLDPR